MCYNCNAVQGLSKGFIHAFEGALEHYAYFARHLSYKHVYFMDIIRGILYT